MTKQQHTPGPWIARTYMGREYNIRPATGAGSTSGYAPIAKVAGDKRLVCAETMRANAALIAAAPDLLAALTEIEAQWSRTGGVPGDAITAARAAIAKARSAA